ncbi:DUF4405 domain-containing protein [Aureimonas sp. Leaf454]|uniref:DUF4405 domain-containing protein n=1 Tax=Aureimonas sp. Leaf454 TaxID=1736381 RepID=UPI0012E38D29|nr:DUF4405 domain-containing protein [Aureimonas sp. Leaf454]
MRSILLRYATPLTTGLFIVSLVSGVALFFHFEGRLFKAMHEWLSMILAVPFGLHLWKNWRPLVSYFKRPPMTVALLASLVGALAFAVPAMLAPPGGGNPMQAVLGAVQNGTIAHLAPLFGHTPDSLAEAMRGRGLVVASSQARLGEVAEASNRTARDMLPILADLRR